MDPIIITSILSAVAVAVSWFAKEIIKPWSDAYLLRSQAFSRHVEAVSEALTGLVTEAQKQTGLLSAIDNRSAEQNATLSIIQTQGEQAALQLEKANEKADRTEKKHMESTAMLGQLHQDLRDNVHATRGLAQVVSSRAQLAEAKAAEAKAAAGDAKDKAG